MSNRFRIHKLTIGDFAVNNYLIVPENSSSALLIDAGYPVQPILDFLSARQLHLKYVVNTHGHGDHIAGNQDIIEATGASLLIHEQEVEYLRNPQLNLSAFLGFALKSPEPTRLLQEGDRVKLEELEFTVLHTPGHTPGHLTLLLENHAFVGDVIFREGIGRTDFPRASHHQLITTIREKIYQLPDDTILHPGHGPDTTVGYEKTHNPFVSM